MSQGFQGGFRQCMAWLHTWSGLILGWLLFAIFLTGALSFYRDEISVWMQPEIHASVPDADTAQRAVDQLAILAPDATSWNITLPGARHPAVELAWRAPGAEGGRRGLTRATLDAGTGEVLEPRDTRGGGFLYRFHFELYGMERQSARWIVGIATMMMFVGILSGIVTHKKIFKDFFTFRPGKGQRSWLDAHNATAVLALPFHLMITYSGLLLIMTTLMPWGIDAAYEGGGRGFYSELRGGGSGGTQAPPNASGRGARTAATSGETAAGPLVPMAPLIAQATARWGHDAIGSISIDRPSGPRSTIELRARHGTSLLDRGARAELLFDGANGTLRDPDAAPPVSGTRGLYNVFTSLHLLHFADPVLRALFFAAGLLGTAMVATGLVLWVEKRAPARIKLGRTPFGHRIVEVLNIGAISGLLLAIAAYFWANRLLPADWPQRADGEIHAFFLAWLLSAIHPLFRTHRQAWIEQLALAAALYALPPAFDWVTRGWPSSPVVLSVDGVLLTMAVGLGYTAWRIARPRASQRPAGRGLAVAAAAGRPAEEQA